MSDSQKRDSSAASSLDSTRQLLDELDALMQRMLSLPVEEKEVRSPAGDKATSVVDAPPSSPPEQGAREDDSPNDEQGSSPFANPADTDGPSYRYEKNEDEETEVVESPIDNGIEETATDEDPPIVSRPDDEQLQPVSSEKLTTLTKPQAEKELGPIITHSRLLAAGAARRKRWWLLPLTAANRLFDLATVLLGPLGAWLRQPSGRFFLGWVGLAFLLAALGLQIFLWVAWN